MHETHGRALPGKLFELPGGRFPEFVEHRLDVLAGAHAVDGEVRASAMVQAIRDRANLDPVGGAPLRRPSRTLGLGLRQGMKGGVGEEGCDCVLADGLPIEGAVAIHPQLSIFARRRALLRGSWTFAKLRGHPDLL